MKTAKIPYKLKTKLQRLAKLANKKAELEQQCLSELEKLGIVDEEWDFVSKVNIKAQTIKDYWIDTVNGQDGNADALIYLMEDMPLVDD